MPETADITAPVLVRVTAMRGGMFWRQNTGAFRTMDGKRVVKVSAYGIADIIGVYLGRAVAIETKTATGRLRETQASFRAAWERAGGLYLIVRNVEGVEDVLRSAAAENRFPSGR
jgi:hypothetical protein